MFEQCPTWWRGVALGGMLVLATRAPAFDAPPHFLVTVLETIDNGETRVRALNASGQSTGAVDVYYIDTAFQAQPDGSVASIETLACEWSRGDHINSGGQVAGQMSVTEGGSSHARAFRYTPGVGMVDLGTPPGTNAAVVDMNDAGDVIGQYGTSGSYFNRAFLYTDAAGFTDLGWLLEEGATEVFDINNAGQIVGTSTAPGWENHAVLWQDGVLHDLTEMGVDGYLTCLNEAGVMAGIRWLDWAHSQAIRYTFGGAVDPLPFAGAAISATPTWITEGGAVYGDDNSMYTYGAFYYTDETGSVAIDLAGSGGMPFGMRAGNNAGWALAHIHDGTTYITPMLFAPQFGLHRLLDLMVEDFDGLEFEAFDINDAGQIVGLTGTFADWQSILLTPVATGDLNCDGQVNAFDVDPFVLALTAPDAYAAAYPRCGADLADIDQDGAVTSFDIDPFVELLSSR